MKYVKANEVLKVLGVKPRTLREWADKNLINYIRTAGGTRLYDINSIIGLQDSNRINLCYCRVSSAKQKDDLQRQVSYMREHFPGYTIITDIGSGINFKRKGLKTLLEYCYSNEIGKVVVAHKDRLTRFGFDLIKNTIERFGGQLLVLSNSVGESPQQELATDLLTILQVFSCRMHGLRKYKNEIKKDKTLSDCRTEENN